MSAPARDGVSRLDRVHARYRARLIAGEASATRDLGVMYNAVWKDLEPRVQALTESLTGVDVTDPDFAYRVFQEERYVRLQNLLAAEMESIAPQVETTIAKAQRYGSIQGRDGALDLIEATYGDMGREMVELRRLPREDIVQMVGYLQTGSPLRELTQELGRAAGTQVRNGLISGLAMGLNPNQVASNVKKGFGGNLSRARMVARTEMMRAHRMTTLEHFQENQAAVAKWRWQATLDSTTCMACVMMHGQEFDLTRPMASHPACRCRMSPIPPRSRLPRQSGEEWFRELNPETQRRMMGPDFFAAWEDGQFDLSDLVKHGTDPDWGEFRRVSNLSEMTSAAGRARARAIRMGSPPPARPTPERIRTDLLQQAREAGWDPVRYREVSAEADRLAAIWSKRPEGTPLADHPAYIEYKTWDRMRSDMVRAKFQFRDAVKTDSPGNARAATVRGRAETGREANLDEGFKAFNDLVESRPGLRDMPVNVEIQGRTTRAYAAGDRIVLANYLDTTTTVHELGHILENMAPEVRRKAFEFYARRTQGESLKKLRDVSRNPGYDPSEVTRTDAFRDPYMGKWYTNREGQQRSTEIISMGLEEMHRDPVGFAETDPDYFDFIMGIMRNL